MVGARRDDEPAVVEGGHARDEGRHRRGQRSAGQIGGGRDRERPVAGARQAAEVVAAAGGGRSACVCCGECRGWRRGRAGAVLAHLGEDLDRCRRSNGQLVVCYIDVVGLKALNDSHGAGDELLKRVVTLIQAHLRSYDLIIRLGGDEFLCAMSSMTLPDARKRFSDVTALLAASPDAGAIRTGFAQLTPDETAANLIARADNELLNHRD